MESIDDLLVYLETQPSFFFFSSKAKALYTKAPYENNSLLIFGAETEGLPEIFWEKWPERFFTIPMRPETRCLNLASSVAIVLYEGLRQTEWGSISQPL